MIKEEMSWSYTTVDILFKHEILENSMAKPPCTCVPYGTVREYIKTYIENIQSLFNLNCTLMQFMKHIIILKMI
jgi:hypothetical protein